MSHNASPPTLDAAGLGLAQVVQSASARVPALANRIRECGLDPSTITDAEVGQLPVISKDEVIEHQRAQPPFGGLVAEDAQIVRTFQSPGPLYEPQLAGRDPWRWAPALAAAGIGHGDTVLNCFGYHLSPAGAMFEEGALAAGARVVPGGIGNQALQAQAIAALAVTAYTGLPSYLKALIDAFDEQGLARDQWRLAKALTTAEPLPDSLRALLQERVGVVLTSYGTAEVGLIAYETEAGAGLLPAPGVVVDVCDLATGQPVEHGEGQVVVSLLREDYPLVRFGTGDLSAWLPTEDGAPRRLAGVLGRVGEAVKVRGMFLHPRQATAALKDVDGIHGFRFVIERIEHRDELTCEVVTAAADPAAVLNRVHAAVRSGLRFTAAVRAVDELPVDGPVIVDRRTWD